MEKGLLFVISGPSGVGKGTVCNYIIEDEHIDVSISATTRNPRKGEVDGEDYFFLSKEDFLKKIDEDAFIEHAKVYENHYGTLRKHVEDQLKVGTDLILEIEMQGAKQVKEKYPEGIFIFLLPPSMEELRNRIEGRGTETQASIAERYACAIQEIRKAKDYDYVIVNDKIENSVNLLKSIISAERCRTNENLDELIKKYEEETLCFIHRS